MNEFFKVSSVWKNYWPVSLQILLLEFCCNLARHTNYSFVRHFHHTSVLIFLQTCFFSSLIFFFCSNLLLIQSIMFLISLIGLFSYSDSTWLFLKQMSISLVEFSHLSYFWFMHIIKTYMIFTVFRLPLDPSIFFFFYCFETIWCYLSTPVFFKLITGHHVKNYSSTDIFFLLPMT